MHEKFNIIGNFIGNFIGTLLELCWTIFVTDLKINHLRSYKCPNDISLHRQSHKLKFMILEIAILFNGVYDILCFVAIFSMPWWKRSQKTSSPKPESSGFCKHVDRCTEWMKALLSMLGKMHSAVFSSPMMNDCDEETEPDHDMQICTGSSSTVPSIQKRILAYWILSHGLVRLLSGLCLLLPGVGGNSKGSAAEMYLFFAVSSTYFVEAVAFALEDMLFLSTVRSKSTWVYGTSLVLGVLALLAGLDKL